MFILKRLIFFTGITLCFCNPLTALAQSSRTPDYENPFNSQMLNIGEQAGFDSTEAASPLVIANQIIRLILSVVGIGMLASTIYAGFLWMTAGGNDDQVGKAKKILRNSLVALILITSAYSLSYFIARRIQRESGSFGGSMLEAGVVGGGSASYSGF